MVAVPMMPVIVSFYTIGTPYEVMSARLRMSCMKLGLEHDFAAIWGRGSWNSNTAAKAELCRNAWERLGQPILWVDADAVFHSSPELLRGATEDVGVHKWKGKYLATGTVFFNQTALAGRLLNEWVDRCADGDSDQAHFQQAWEALPELRTLWLPRSYCQIFDSPRDEPAVIEHFQASRQNRATA
jgi:hypothetical protein